MSNTNTLSLPLDVHISNPFFVGEMPLPPGTNQSYKRVTIRRRSGQTYGRLGGTDELHRFKHDAALTLSQGRENTSVLTAIRQSTEKVPLAVTVLIYFPTLWLRDIDGCEKAAIDAVFSHLGLNDNLIVDKNTKKRVDRNNPHIKIEVSCILTTGE